MATSRDESEVIADVLHAINQGLNARGFTTFTSALDPGGLYCLAGGRDVRITVELLSPATYTLDNHGGQAPAAIRAHGADPKDYALAIDEEVKRP